MKFDPFNDRLCRDIRNDLSRSFTAALGQGDIQNLYNVATGYLYQEIGPVRKEYVETRLDRYERIFDSIRGPATDNDVFLTVLYLWDEELFYELHEYLEYQWKRGVWR